MSRIRIFRCLILSLVLGAIGAVTTVVGVQEGSWYILAIATLAVCSSGMIFFTFVFMPFVAQKILGLQSLVEIRKYYSKLPVWRFILNASEEDE